MRKAAATGNLSERAQIMGEAEKIMLDEAPIVPVYYYVKKSMVKPHVKGWQANVIDVHPTRWLSIQR